MIFIGVGSNLGDRWAALTRAWEELERRGVHVLRSSFVYETQPWGDPHQPLYLNAVWEVETQLCPEELLKVMQAVEWSLGRPQASRRRWGARIIDLDLLAYGGEERSSHYLTLPHPWIPYRAFVLGPWSELAPYFYLRRWHATVGELWQRCYASEWGSRVSPPAGVKLPLILSPLIPPAGPIL
ncbi:MAG: 2-amino-4-hydroxy-6-hydroxymethyldihydropteridine diphosphokinase [Bacteroidia bacterium]|nr:2-amino-4-hydroxy-6-hydroxymethyldihydropteridine diphosphokinase [Bacteroidia bacterium]